MLRPFLPMLFSGIFLLLTACAGGAYAPDDGSEVVMPAVNTANSKPEVARSIKLGREAEAAGKIDSAAMLYRGAVIADASDAAPKIAMARLLETTGDPGAGASMYEAALQQEPRNKPLRLAAARAWLKQKNYTMAAAHYARVAEEDGDWRAYNGLGVVRGLQGNEKAARAAYEKALQFAPATSASKVRTNLALSYILANEPRQAVQLLEPVHGQGVETPQETRLLALAYGFMGRVEDAQMLGLYEPPSPDLLRELRETPDGPAITPAPREGVQREP